jgi:hypothetical protein
MANYPNVEPRDVSMRKRYTARPQNAVRILLTAVYRWVALDSDGKLNTFPVLSVSVQSQHWHVDTEVTQDSISPPFFDTVRPFVFGIYRLFFGWWLDGIRYQRSEDKLKKRVQQAFTFLFENHAAKFVPVDPGYEWTKGKMVILEAETVRLRVSWYPHDHADIAPLHARTDWEPLPTVLAATTAKRKPVRSEDDLAPHPVFPDMFELGAWLQPHFEQLLKAYSTENYAGTKLGIQMVKCLREFSPPSLGRFSRGGMGGKATKPSSHIFT